MNRASHRWQIPESWSWSPAAAVGEISLGRQRSPENHIGPSMRPYVRAANITWDGWDLSDVKRMNFNAGDFATFRLRPGDVLLNEGSGSANEVGKPAVWEGKISDCCFQNTLLRFRSDYLDPLFVCSFLKFSAREGHLVEHTQGVNIFHIGKRNLEQLPLPVAPIFEQRRIVAKLDALMARLARARAELDRSVLLAKEMRGQSLGRAYAQAAADHQLLPIRYFILKLDQGWSPKCENYPSLSDDEWAVLKTTAVQPLRYLENENKLLPSTLSPRPELEVAVGDVLITRAGPRVRVGISCFVKHTRPKLILADKMYRLRVRPDRAVPEFLAMALNAPQLLERIEPLKTGISDSGLNLTQEKFLSLPVPAIGIDQQTNLVASIQTSFARADRLEAEALRARALLDRLESAILAKAFRGELVPQDPNDEPASVLLERIRAQRGEAPKSKRALRRTN